MTTENSFNPGEVEPAKVNFIDNNDQEEHLDGKSTPAKVEDTPTAPVAPDAQAPNTPPVHAETQDSDERYRNLQAAYTKVSQENSELRSRLERLEAGLTQQQSIPQQQFAQPAPSTPAEPDELDTVADEFPELKPIASRMKKMQESMDAQQSTLTNQQESLDKTAQETAQDRQNRAILEAHNDAYQIAGSVDFQGWLARQPSYMQPWMQTGTAEQVIDLLTAYKVAAGQPPAQQQNQQQQLDEARIAGAPDNNQAPILDTNNSKIRTFRSSEINAMSDAEFVQNEGAITLAQNTPGGIIIDT